MNNLAVHMLQEEGAGPQGTRKAKQYPVPHRYLERVWKFLPGLYPSLLAPLVWGVNRAVVASVSR